MQTAGTIFPKTLDSHSDDAIQRLWLPRFRDSLSLPWMRISLTSLCVSLFGCSASNDSEIPAVDANRPILREATDSGLWFHAKKTRPIWARKLEQEETVSTLEGDEQVPAGNYLCRGEAGDIWPQTEKRLYAKYIVSEESDDEGWHTCVPRPDAEGVLAAQIPHSFEVVAQWGTLSGKANDFLVKNYEDRDDPAPLDVWIVDQDLFEATYERVAD